MSKITPTNKALTQGDAISVLAHMMDYSPTELAESVKLAVASVHNILTGLENPGEARVKDFAKALGVSVRRLRGYRRLTYRERMDRRGKKEPSA